MPTLPKDPLWFRITETFVKSWDALPLKGTQIIAANAAAAGISRDDAKNSLAKAANAGIATEHTALSPFRYSRTPRNELNKDQLALLKRIDQARDELAA